MKNWRSERDNYPHVGKLADAIDELKSLASSGFTAPPGLGRVMAHVEPVVGVIDKFYKDEKVCNLVLECVQSVTRSVKNGRIEHQDERRILEIARDLRFYRGE